MSEVTYLKIACERCGEHSEYPSDMAGQSVQCPHCQHTIPLPPPLPVLPQPTPSPPPPLPPPIATVRQVPTPAKRRLTTCRDCGHAISSKATSCPACGAPVNRANKRTKKSLGIAIGMLALFIVLVTIGVKSSNEQDQRITKQLAAEHRENEQAIKIHHVLEGMSADEVIRAWGKPKRIVRLSDAKGDSEEWNYGSASLYFRNGKVEASRRETENP